MCVNNMTQGTFTDGKGVWSDGCVCAAAPPLVDLGWMHLCIQFQKSTLGVNVTVIGSSLYVGGLSHVKRPL